MEKNNPVVRLADKAHDSRHVTPDDILARAVEARNSDDVTKTWRKCVIIFSDSDGTNFDIEYFGAGCSKLECIGIVEKYKHHLLMD